MDFVSRAKALLMRQARTAALAIVPLAAAIESQAATLPTGNFDCTADDSGFNLFNCSGGAGALSPLNGITGVGLYTSGPVFFSQASGGGVATLALSTFGTLDQTISGGVVIPLKYDFTLDTFAATIDSWTLTLSIFQNVAQSDFTPTAFGDIAEVIINGTSETPTSGIASLVSTGFLSGFETTVTGRLTVNWTPNDFESGISINVPAGSTFDFNVDNVPEPGSVALMGLGLALVGGYRLVQRRNGFSIEK